MQILPKAIMQLLHTLGQFYKEMLFSTSSTILLFSKRGR
jgi:hypothetical protein